MDNSRLIKAKFVARAVMYLKYAVLASFFAGVIFGIMRAYVLNGGEFDTLSDSLIGFLDSLNGSYIVKVETFIECIIKYGKIFFVIWFLAFIPTGFIFILFFIFFKGLSGGFTTAFLYREMGVAGIYYGFLMFFLQSAVLIPSVLHMASSAIQYNLKNMTGKGFKGKYEYSPEKSIGFGQYLSSLLMGLAAVLLASLVEVYITPILIKFM